MKQSERILRHLQDYGSITSWEAITEYGVTRLSAVIYILRKLGYDISIEFKTSLNRYNEKVSYGVYKLNDEK